ncbi:hypothetical protein acdb102_22470 [Acidothermaceae bacterium B102]|nr:hypothetical protein acdb102_22470 [Acidothermaceae bacterium B102]
MSMGAGPGGGPESMTVVCPDCQRPSRVGTNRCPNCGYPLALESAAHPTAAVDPTLFVSPGDERPERRPPPPPPEDHEARAVRLAPRLAGSKGFLPTETGTMCPSCRKVNPPERERWCAWCAMDMSPPLAAPPPPPLPKQHTVRRRWPLAVLAVLAVAAVGGTAFALGHVGHGHKKTLSAPPVTFSTTTASPSPPATPAAHLVAVARADITAQASNTRESPPGQYSIDNTLDGLPTTAWNSDGDITSVGTGIGITLTYRFSHPVDLRSVVLRNGYVASSHSTDPFDNNERLRNVLITTATASRTATLLDTRSEQHVLVPQGKTAVVTLTIESVYPGLTARDKDAALTDITFYGKG